jgi:hypothetical protein
MTIVHLAGITPNGLTAALMVCGGLTKVKLHEAFKSMMPPHMLKNVEARGCIFQWINKPFKVLYIVLLPCLYVPELCWILVSITPARLCVNLRKTSSMKPFCCAVMFNRQGGYAPLYCGAFAFCFRWY